MMPLQTTKTAARRMINAKRIKSLRPSGLALNYAPMKTYLKLATVVAFVCALLSLPSAALTAAETSHSFKVHNTTKNAIKKLLASEDGKSYGNFDIGNGIAPGATVTLVWDKSTDEEDCSQYFKAVFDDKEESEAVNFDFCEEDLTLEF